MSKQACKRLRRALGMDVNRKPLDSFAWPGGYPLWYLTADGGVLCPDCVNAHVRRIGRETADYWRGRPGADRGWALVSAEPNYEDGALTCDHCNRRIDAAYGDDEESTPAGPDSAE